MIRKTSIETYKAIQDSGHLGRTQREVYNALYQYGPLTQNELHFWHFQERQPRDVQPRVSELVKLGVVKSAGKRQCNITGRVCMTWETTDEMPVTPEPKHRPHKGDAHIAQRIACANEHASAPRLLAWIRDAARSPANTAFTEGPDRQVAYAVEWVFTQLNDARDEIRRLKNGELF